MVISSRAPAAVIIEDRGGHDGAGTGGHYGSWSRVWASRPGIALIRVLDEEHRYKPGRLNYHEDKVLVEVLPGLDFDPLHDYIVVEHKRSPNPYLGGSSSREGYELLAGATMPAWADFPGRWQEWVNDYRVIESAIDHILARCPEAEGDVAYALRKGAKNRRISAWEAVADTCRIDPAKIRGTGSWTSVRAMPIRIAQKLGGWRPPVPRPAYQTGDEAGAVLVASPRQAAAGAD